MKEEIIEKIFKYAIKNADGFTVKIKNGRIYKVKFTSEKRYAVSITNCKTYKEIYLMLKSLPDNFNGYIGGWYNTDEKKYYIDLTLILSDLHIAKIIGKKFNQKVIWDGLENKEIWIKPKRKKHRSVVIPYIEYNI